MTTPSNAVTSSSPVLSIPTNIDYTSKDFSGLMFSMLQYATQAMPDWNTTSEGDFGVALLEAFAYEGDIISYYGDRISQEAYIPTATQRVSLLNIAALLDYQVSNGTPATGSVTFQTSNPGNAVTIPAGTQVATGFDSTNDAPIIYETVTTQTVPANGGTMSIQVSQGVTYTLVPLGTSSGQPGQVFQIPQTGVIDNSTSVYVQTVGGMAQWSQVNYLIDSNSQAQTYSVFLDSNGFTNIQFGDGLNGLIPAQGMTVYATYTVGAGSAGNQPPGVVGILVTPISGVSVQLLSDNITYGGTAMSGGQDPETNDQIRSNAPLTFQTQQRAVGLDDYENLCLNVPGVQAVNAVANHSTSITLYVLGPGQTAPSSGLIANILNYFQPQGGPILTQAGVTLSVAAPNTILIDVGSAGNQVTLQILPQYQQDVVLQNVQTALSQLFSPPNTTFGQLITVGLVYQTITGVAGVEYCIVPLITREDVTQTTTNPIQLRQSEIAVPGNFYINVVGGL
jgi:hypothetical protein